MTLWWYAYRNQNEGVAIRFRQFGTFLATAHYGMVGSILPGHQGMLMKDKEPASAPPMRRLRRGEDGLGPNTDIGAKLRAYYGAVQDQPIPERMLDLLEELDKAERESGNVPSRS